MKRKTTLSLMELAIMVCVFALAAAICLRAFVWADTNSRRSEAESQALLRAQTVAEQLKSTHGDFASVAAMLGGTQSDGQSLTLDYDADWTAAGDILRYTLGAARVESGVPGLGKAGIWVRDAQQETELVRFDVAWQEVMGDD